MGASLGLEGGAVEGVGKQTSVTIWSSVSRKGKSDVVPEDGGRVCHRHRVHLGHYTRTPLRTD